MYSGPAFDWVKNCSADHAAELEHYRHYHHGGEVLFQEQLANHPERERRCSQFTQPCKQHHYLKSKVWVQAYLARTGSTRNCLLCQSL